MAKKKEVKKSKEKANEKPALPQEPTEKHFDFGGLPARDLKKNLGCG